MPILYDLRKDLRFKEGEEYQARTSAIRMLREGIPLKKIADFLDVYLDFINQILKKNLKETNSKNAKSRTKQAD